MKMEQSPPYILLKAYVSTSKRRLGLWAPWPFLAVGVFIIFLGHFLEVRGKIGLKKGGHDGGL